MPRLILRQILTAVAVVAATWLPAYGLSRLTWNAQSIDFGTIKEDDGKVERSFYAKNNSNQSVKIERIRTSCGCTTVARQQFEIAAGDSAILPITFNPIGRPGAFDKQILVYTNDTTYRLNIYGNVKPSAQTIALRFPEKAGSLQLSRLSFMLGEVKTGELRSTRLFGYNMSNDTLNLSMTGMPRDVSVGIYPEIVPPGSTFSVAVNFRGDKNTGFGLHEYQLILNANEEKTVLPLTVTLNADPEYLESESYKNSPVAELSTKRLVFSDYANPKRQHQALTIKNIGKSDLTIKRILSPDNIATVDATYPIVVKPGNEKTITVNIDKRHLSDKVINGELTILTDDPANTCIRIRVAGTR